MRIELTDKEERITEEIWLIMKEQLGLRGLEDMSWMFANWDILNPIIEDMK